MVENWKINNSTEVFTSIPFNILKKTYINPKNDKDFIAHVLNLPDWSNIIGINIKGEILLVKQFRFGTDKVELEIPGGHIEPGELPKEAAIRELKEETGYGVKSIKQIGFVDANPAIMNNKCYTFIAELSEKGDVELDPHEIIDTTFAKPKQVKKYIDEGLITNAYVIVGFLWYILYNNKIF